MNSDLLILPNEGETSGTHLVTKVHASQLDNEYSVMEGVMKSRSLLAPHTHQNEDQVVIVLDGELEFEVDGEGGTRFTAPAGSYVIKPRKRQHTFWNATDEDVRYIELSGGPGFQGFIDDSTERGSMEASRDSEEQFGISWHHDRIPKLMLENKLTSISGVEMPWDKINIGSVKDVLERLRDVLRNVVAG